MNSIYFQLLFKEKANFKEIIYNSVNKALEDNLKEKDEGEIEDWISFNYVKELSSNRFLVGFTLQFELSIL